MLKYFAFQISENKTYANSLTKNVAKLHPSENNYLVALSCVNVDDETGDMLHTQFLATSEINPIHVDGFAQ